MNSEFTDEPQSQIPGQVRSTAPTTPAPTASTAPIGPTAPTKSAGLMGGATASSGVERPTGAGADTVWDTDPGEATDPVLGQGATSNGGQSVTDAAKEQASGVVEDGVNGSKQVASVAADQAKEVASEAGQQAKILLGQAKSELMDHASSQQSRIADQLHALSRELGTMASKSNQDGMATDLARQASRQAGSVAHWLSEREPGSLVTELKDFARRRPGTFLAIAAGVGVVAGRLTRSIQAGAPEDEARAGRTPNGRTTTYPIRQGSSSGWDAPSGASAAGPSSFTADAGGQQNGGRHDGSRHHGDGDSGLVPASPATARARYDDESSPDEQRPPSTSGGTR